MPEFPTAPPAGPAPGRGHQCLLCEKLSEWLWPCLTPLENSKPSKENHSSSNLRGPSWFGELHAQGKWTDLERGELTHTPCEASCSRWALIAQEGAPLERTPLITDRGLESARRCTELIYYQNEFTPHVDLMSPDQKRGNPHCNLSSPQTCGGVWGEDFSPRTLYCWVREPLVTCGVLTLAMWLV